MDLGREGVYLTTTPTCWHRRPPPPASPVEEYVQPPPGTLRFRGEPPVITAGIRAELHEEAWVREVSESFPDGTFRLLTGVPTDRGAVELGSVTAAEPEVVVAAIEAHPAIWGVERLAETEDVVLVRYETADTGLYEFAADSSIPPPYPLIVRDGWYEFEFTGTRDDLDLVRSYLEAADCAFELRYLRGTDESAGLVTDRQCEVLETARRTGYFEVPRDCTLADVAETLGIDTSTASGILRRGQARIVTWYLTGAAGDPGR